MGQARPVMEEYSHSNWFKLIAAEEGIEGISYSRKNAVHNCDFNLTPFWGLTRLGWTENIQKL
jgi:hypothetical protein